MIAVLSAGPLTTLQDYGRRGYAAAGYPTCGAADKYAMRLANLLAGNGAKSRHAVLEYTLAGPTLRFDTTAVVALAGAQLHPQLNGRPAAMYCPLYLRPGDTLALGTAAQGLRGYLAVFGGLDGQPVMGSLSTDLKCHIGGLAGRALKNGDRLAIRACARDATRCWQRLRAAMAKHHFDGPAPEWLCAPLHPWRICGAQRVPLLRAVAGPQEDSFTPAGLDTFVRSIYHLTADCNRMACKLTGAAIACKNGSDILSDGIVEGSVQVAADGHPIVMLADHQTTGGYAKIATVIEPDVAVLAQLRPGEGVAFRLVSPEEAVAACRSEAKKLEWLEEQLT